MSIFYQAGYAPPTGDMPLTHARIAHSGNWLEGGTITASGTASGFYSDAPDNSLTYEKWQADTLPAYWGKTNAVSAAVDYCCIAAHTLGDNFISVTVQYSNNGTDWTDVATGTPQDNSPIMFIFDPITAPHWRVYLEGGFPETPTLILNFETGVYGVDTLDSQAATIGVCRFGSAMQMPQALYGGLEPLIFARKTVMKSNITTTGEWVGRSRVRNQLGTTFNWEHLKADWMRANWLPFEKASETEPFFLAWRPASFGEVGYCYIDGHNPPSNMGIKSYMAASLAVRAYAYD